MIRLYVLVFILFFTTYSDAANKPVLRIVGETWKGITNADGTGTYFDIVRATLGDKYQLKIHLTSWTRATQMVKNGDADVLVGSYQNRSDELVYSDRHIDTEHPIYVVYDPDKFVPKSADDLADKLIAGRKGWGLQHYLPSSTQFYGVDSIKDISKLIAHGRIDGALAYGYNLLLVDPKSEFSNTEVIPEMSLHLAFTANENGRRLRQEFDERMSTLLDKNVLSTFFKSDLAYQHANLKPKNFASKVSWNLIPKIFNKTTQSLDVVPWELNTTKYIASQLKNIEMDVTFNSFSKTKVNLESNVNNCSLSIRKPKELKGNIIYSNLFHLYIKPRLFVLKGSTVESELNLLTQNTELSLREMLDQYPKFRVVIQDNFGINKRLKKSLGESYSNRILNVAKSEYHKLINMLIHKRVDALIVWPSIISDLNTDTVNTGLLTSMAINEDIVDSLFTYIACHNDDLGKKVINEINHILSIQSHQKSIYFPFIKKLDVNSAELYKSQLGLTF